MKKKTAEGQKSLNAKANPEHPENVSGGNDLRQFDSILLGLGFAALLVPFALQKIIPFPNLASALAPDLIFTAAIAWLTWPCFRERLKARSRDAWAVSTAAFAVAIVICGSLKKMGIDEGQLYGVGPKTFFILVVYAPIVEEVLFRYALWTPLEHRFGPYPALITTSVIFSLSHLFGYFDAPAQLREALLAQGAVTLAFGMVIGAIYLRTRSISIAMLGHAFANLGAFIIMTLT
jgi:membrane protease YdiL (CAAX protease family)